jgi:epoxyqueuosine reductase
MGEGSRHGAMLEAVVTTELIQQRALELGISACGVARAEHYERTEADIAARGERGLFADLKFTMSRPEESCHPERALPAARSVVSCALSYWHPEPPGDAERPATGRIARYTRADAYEALVERLHLLRALLEEHGATGRVLVDSNSHVDREGAARSGVGFYGKNTNVITRRFGSWVVLGTLVTDALLETTEPMRAGCGSCTACIDACPTGAIIEAGVLDTRSCITYWTQSRHSIPTDIREAMGDMVYGCDICQDVCPWNRGVEGRRVGEEPRSGRVDLVDWLTAPDAELNERYERFFVPRRKMRFLRRNALVALGNSGRPENAALVAPFLDDEDALLREHAHWALERLGGPIAAAALARVSRPGDDRSAQARP